MAWPIYLLVTCLVQSQVLEIRAYPAAVTLSPKNNTVVADMNIRIDITMPNDHAPQQQATAKTDTTANITIINSDGENKTTFSTTHNEISPENATTSETNLSNVHLNVETIFFMEISDDGEIVAFTSNTTKLVTAVNGKGESANSTAVVVIDLEGNKITDAKSTMSSDGEDNTEEAEGVIVDFIIETIFDMYLPKDGKNITAKENTTSKMIMFHLDHTNSTVESYSVAQTDDDFNGSMTVSDLGDDMIKMAVKTKVSVKMPPGGMPKADSISTTTTKGKTSYTETEAKVSIGRSHKSGADISGGDTKQGDETTVKQSEDATAKQSDDVTAKKDDKYGADKSGSDAKKGGELIVKPAEDATAKQSDDVTSKRDDKSGADKRDSDAKQDGEATVKQAKDATEKQNDDVTAKKDDKSGADKSGSDAKKGGELIVDQAEDATTKQSDDVTAKKDDKSEADKSGSDAKEGNESTVENAEDATAKESDYVTAKKDDKAVKQENQAEKKDEVVKSAVDTAPVS